MSALARLRTGVGSHTHVEEEQQPQGNIVVRSCPHCGEEAELQPAPVRAQAAGVRRPRHPGPAVVEDQEGLRGGAGERRDAEARTEGSPVHARPQSHLAAALKRVLRLTEATMWRGFGSGGCVRQNSRSEGASSAASLSLHLRASSQRSDPRERSQRALGAGIEQPLRCAPVECGHGRRRAGARQVGEAGQRQAIATASAAIALARGQHGPK